MPNITLQGAPIRISGDLPPVGSSLPNFNLTGADLSQRSLSDFAGKKMLLNIFPSVDTPICASSIRHFGIEVGDRAILLCISADLPFAQKRFCSTEGIPNAITLSNFRNASFANDFGIAIMDGPMEGLLARAVVVVDEHGKITYTELVSEIAKEPNYEATMAHL